MCGKQPVSCATVKRRNGWTAPPSRGSGPGSKCWEEPGTRDWLQRWMCIETGEVLVSSLESGLGWVRERKEVKLARVIGSDWTHHAFDDFHCSLSSLAWSGSEEASWGNPSVASPSALWSHWREGNGSDGLRWSKGEWENEAAFVEKEVGKRGCVCRERCGSYWDDGWFGRGNHILIYEEMMLSAKGSLQDIRTIISLDLYFGKFKTKHCVTNSISQGRSHWVLTCCSLALKHLVLQPPTAEGLLASQTPQDSLCCVSTTYIPD